MKNILITGVNGFIGSHMAQYCLQQGYHVIGVDMASISDIPQVDYYQIDLCSDSLDEVLTDNKPFAIIHCAGLADVNYSINHPDTDFSLNVMVSRKVLYSIKEFSPDSRFVFLSSAAVYGNPVRLPITENMSCNPISPYALHKVLVENICRYFSKQQGIDVRILRIFSAYGNGLKKQIFWDMGKKFAEQKKLNLFGTGCETRDFIHINDLVKAIFILMNASKTEDITYNVANGVEISIREIAEIFCDKMKEEHEIIHFSNNIRTGNPVNWCADISRLKALGYVQSISIDRGIEEYVKWLKTNCYIG